MLNLEIVECVGERLCRIDRTSTSLRRVCILLF